MHKTLVHTAQRNTVIYSGVSALTENKLMLTRHLRQKQLFVVFDATVYALHGKRVIRALPKSSNIEEFVVPSGESAKTEQIVSALHSFFLSNGIARDSFVIAVGGGSTSDVVGYAASTILRGVEWGVISTTLLGMVDAAIGGKTGINHRAGKNLIGTIWQPSFVINDVSFLQTMPSRDLYAGLGEIIKYAGLIGGRYLATTTRLMKRSATISESELTKVVALSAAYKAKIVSQDERETGRRIILNYGHTVAHAIEKNVGFGKVRHGEAVLIGIWCALEVGRLHGVRQDRAIIEYQALVEHALSKISIPILNPSQLIGAMSLDKKRTQGIVRYILLKRPGLPIVVSTVTKRQIQLAITAFNARMATLKK